VRNHYSIRAYLILLVLGVMVPFLALHVALLYHHTQQDKDMAERAVVALANVAAGDTEHFLYDAKNALQRIARQPAVLSLDQPRCHSYLRAFPCINPNFCSISVVTRSGQLVCSESEPPAKAVNVAAEKTWLPRVVQGKGFVVSEPFIDPDTSRHVIVLGYPLTNEHSVTIGAVAIAVDLLDYDSVHYKNALANAKLPSGSVVTIINSAGYVIARWPNAAQWVGAKVGEVEIVRRLHATHSESVIQARGMDGVEKLYGFVHIVDTDWYLYTGIPTAAIVAPSVDLLIRNALLGAVIALLATLLAIYLSGIIRRPIRTLAKVVSVAAQGSMEVRVPREGPQEILEVGERFNEMLVARTKAEEALAEEKERVEVTLASIGDAVITTDAAGNVTYLNPVAERLTGWNTVQAKGLSLFKIVNLVDTASRTPLQKTLAQAIEDGFLVSVADSTILIRRDGQEIPVADCAAPIRDRAGHLVGTVLVFRDISRAQDLTSKLSWQATHDALTGLVNRAEFEARLGLSLSSARQEARHHALLYLDLDQFKIVNDTCGHTAGDELLRRLTALLQIKIRGNDTLARLGGDEFGVLLENCPLEQALRIADELREIIQDFRFAWKDKTFNVGVSIGVVPIDAYSEDLAHILSAADAACYTAKEKGRNRVNVYQRDNLDFAQRLGEMEWVQRITHAFEEQRFLLYCQPIVPLGVVGPNGDRQQEILIRLRDEQGEILLPGSFLPAAERYNLMPTIDRWVIRTLFMQLSAHPHAMHSSELYSVNISGHALSEEHFLDFVIDQFAQSKIPAARICFEITETAAIANLTQATRFITQLKKMGCSFSLDDFGTGLSSFTYLKNLPVDHLKIAGSFVADILTDTMDCAVTEMINHIGHVMHIKTVAESVENLAILAKVRSLGVDYAQGFGIAHPMLLQDCLAAKG